MSAYKGSVLFLIVIVTGCSSPPPTSQWVHTGGPHAQNVTSLCVDTKNPSQLLAGLSTGEVFRSTTGGRTWENVSTLPSSPPIHRIIQHPEDAGRFLAASSAGLFTSSNAGKTWNPLRVSPDGASCHAIALDPFNPAQMYVGFDNGIFVTGDGGSTWTSVSAEQSVGIVHDIVVDSQNPDLVFAATSSLGLIKSTDRGTTWRALTGHLAKSGTIPLHILLHQKNDGIVLIGTSGGDVYRSSNGGETWSPTRQGTGKIPVRSMATHPTLPDHVYAGTDQGTLVSMDFGSTWRPATTNLPSIPISFAFARSGNTPYLFAYGPGIGLRQSTDGGSGWNSIDRGLGGSTIPFLATSPSDQSLYAVTGNAVYLFKEASESWVSASSGLQGGAVFSLTFDQGTPPSMFAGTEGGVFRTTDAGVSWNPVPLTMGTHTVRFFAPHPAIKTRMLAFTDAGLFVSTDKGETWKPSKPHGEAYDVRSITFSPKDAGSIFISTFTRGLFRSEDGGLTWEKSRFGIKDHHVLAVTRSEVADKTLFAWSKDGSGYRSKNHGIEWDTYVPPWNFGDEIHMSVVHDNPGEVVALVNRTIVYYSWNGGATWRAHPVDPLPAQVISVHWHPMSATLFVGTTTSGVYRLNLKGFVAAGSS